MPQTFVKDPEATLDYAIDWSDWLDPDDTIASATWIVPDGLDQATPPPSLSGTVATIWLTGGTVGQRYALTCRVTTTAGRVDDRTIRIRIAQL